MYHAPLITSALPQANTLVHCHECKDDDLMATTTMSTCQQYVEYLRTVHALTVIPPKRSSHTVSANPGTHRDPFEQPMEKIRKFHTHICTKNDYIIGRICMCVSQEEIGQRIH